MTSKQETLLFIGLGSSSLILLIRLSSHTDDFKGLLGFCASRVIHKQLLSVKKACEIARTVVSECVSTQGTEDAIKLETLDELSINANEEIRTAAIKIVTERASNSSARYILLRDLRSRNHERRDKALTAILYLHQEGTASLSAIAQLILTVPVPGCFDADKYTVIQSIIGCLSNLLPLSLEFETARRQGREAYRTQPERDALEIIYIFMSRFGVEVALECKLFDLWLARYPFGGKPEMKSPSDEDAQPDLALRRITTLIATEEKGRQALFDNGFFHERRARSEASDNIVNDDQDRSSRVDRFSRIWYEVHGTANAPDPGLGPMMRRGYRVREESVEEQALRRRRREAMVLGEMGRPIESEDIIQRVNT
ncbi:MAG: hypothetical protein Q9224_001419 [Gallowayella concinna]